MKYGLERTLLKRLQVSLSLGNAIRCEFIDIILETAVEDDEVTQSFEP